MPEKVMYTGFSDVAVKTDSLGIDDFCKGLAEFIKSCSTPITVAVQGGWGTGKSSVMKIIEEKIKDDVCCVDFNSWKYAKTSGESLILPLIREFEKKITKYAKEKNNKEYLSKFENKENTFKKLLTGAMGALYFTGRGIVEYMASKISIGNTGLDLADKVENTLGDTEERMISIYESLDDLHKELGDRIECLCKDEGPERVVVFIDDLDRIAPKDAVNLLEDMKNIMDFEKCVFVLALDNAIVQRGLKAKYGDELENEYSEKFFDKLIQLPFNLPLDLYDIEEYIGTLNKKCHIGSTEEIKSIVELLNHAGIVNPRAIKRLLNTLLLYKKTYNDDLEKTSSKYFAMIILQSEYRNSYGRILRMIRDKGWLNEVCVVLRGVKTEDFWSEIIECFDEENTSTKKKFEQYINRVREAFEQRDFGFIDILMKTSITGNGEMPDREIMTQKMKSILIDYIDELFADWEKDTSTGIGRRNGDNRVYATIPNSSREEDKHVNLQINTKYGQKLVEGEKPCIKLQDYTGLSVSDGNDGGNKDTTQMVLYEDWSFCFRNLSPNQKDYVKYAGEFLRNFKAEGSLLPTSGE